MLALLALASLALALASLAVHARFARGNEYSRTTNQNAHPANQSERLKVTNENITQPTNQNAHTANQSERA